ncbi:hypothetical protein D6779_09245 [Candidatus Parcubacteria bacterium]|nr:MAG: hypothetical protein D6779_09245 [Candidatus Parcubacteria bacterium]
MSVKEQVTKDVYILRNVKLESIGSFIDDNPDMVLYTNVIFVDDNGKHYKMAMPLVVSHDLKRLFEIGAKGDFYIFDIPSPILGRSFSSFLLGIKTENDMVSISKNDVGYPAAFPAFVGLASKPLGMIFIVFTWIVSIPLIVVWSVIDIIVKLKKNKRLRAKLEEIGLFEAQMEVV